MIRNKIPTTIVTGFLGAGKTTLIRHVLENANGRRIALIVNEFGEVGIDGEILKSCGDALCREEDIIELANGCICCTVADDFIPTMSQLLGRDKLPDHIVIETSGLALPQPLVRAFNWPEIKSRVTVDGVVTVVDGRAVAEGRFAEDETAVAVQRAADPNVDHDNPIEELFQDQLTCADIVLLNKADLLEAADLERIKFELSPRLRPGTRLIATENGKIDISALLGLAALAEADIEQRPSNHELEAEGEHDHDDFESFVVSIGTLSDRAVFLDRVQRLIARHEILRLKGFIALSGVPSRLLIQAVGPRVDSYFDRPWRSGEERRCSLVIIGLKGMNREAIMSGLQSAFD
jgi:cobalamin biosynthesis protein CobW